MANTAILRLPTDLSTLSIFSSPHDVTQTSNDPISDARETDLTSDRYEREPFYRDDVLIHAATRVPLEEEDNNSSAGSDYYDTDLETNHEPTKTDESEVGSTLSSMNKKHYRSVCDRIGIAPQEAIALGLEEPEMNIRYRCLGDNDMNAMCSALLMNDTVTRLELSGNSVGPNGIRCLRDLLTSNSYITHLDLSDNDLGRHQESAAVLSELIRSNTLLFALNLAGNNFKDQDIIYLAVGIQMNSRLQQLDLSRNKIGERGALQLGRAFSVNNGIDVLDLSWNCIRQKGAVGLCKGFQENGYVTKLNLSWNGLGYEGALAFGEVLKKNFVLSEVNLASNRINWKAIQLIANGLRKNKSVETLILDSNPLTTTGCLDLLDAIYESNSTLINLSLKEIPVIGDFELLTMMIRQSRPEFKCVHGGITSSHDILGQRMEKRETPLQKLLKSLREREVKTAQLFNDAKSLSTSETLALKLKHFGVSLKQFEVDELYDYLKAQLATQNTSDGLNYKSLSSGIKSHKDRERLEKIRVLEQEEQTRQMHRKILTEPNSVDVIDLANVSDINGILPPISSAHGSRTASKTSFKTRGSTAGKERLPEAIVRLGTNLSLNNRGHTLISMSTTLGARAMSFGEGGEKKTKKSKKTSAKSKKKKKKGVDTTDYESML